jgi:Clostripain family
MTNNVPKLKWTVMVYMVADTSDSFYRDAMANITAMTNAGFDDQIKVVVHADAPSPWRAKCWEVKGATKVQGNCTEIDCGHRCLLRFVEKYVKDPNKAENYLLVVWGHDAGIKWREKVLGKREAGDPGSVGVMDVAELGKALKEMHVKLEKDIKDKVVLGFDTCLMGMVEVYDEIQPYVGWAVAANDEIPVTGWPYKEILSLLGNKPEMGPRELAKEIVNECRKSYSDTSHESKVSFSACELNSEISKRLKGAATDLTFQLIKELEKNSGSVVEAIREARDFAQDYQEEAYVDLHAFCSKLQLRDGMSNDLVGVAKKVNEVLEDFVINHKFSDNYPGMYMGESRAVSICFPESADLAGSVSGIKVDWRSYEALDFSKKTEWPKFLREFWKRDTVKVGGTYGERTNYEKGRAAGQG